MNVFRTSIALFILMIFARGSLGQAIADFCVAHYNSDNGLRQKSTMKTGIHTSSALWFSAYAGVARFDGSHFEVFDHHNTQAIQSNRIIKTGLPADST